MRKLYNKKNKREIAQAGVRISDLLVFANFLTKVAPQITRLLRTHSTSIVPKKFRKHSQFPHVVKKSQFIPQKLGKHPSQLPESRELLVRHLSNTATVERKPKFRARHQKSFLPEPRSGFLSGSDRKNFEIGAVSDFRSFPELITPGSTE